MEVKTKMKKVLAVAGILLAVAILVSPVMAFGPGQAAEVGNNKNLKILEEEDAVINYRGAASGLNTWVVGETEGDWVQMRFRDTRDAKGLMNNALMCHLTDVNPTFLLVDNENNWIYLSGDASGQPNQFKGHGTFYLFMVKLFGPTDAGAMAIEYPEGVFYMYNIVK